MHPGGTDSSGKPRQIDSWAECFSMTSREREQHDHFLRLFVRHEESLRGFVRTLVGTREDALDVMQEVAAVLWRKYDDLESPDDFRRWAFGVARMEALAFRRDRSRDRHTFDDDVLALIAAEAEEAADDLQRERELMDRCMRKLPESQRLLVTTVYTRGTRIDALAARLGRTPMSLYKHLHRIRMALMECVSRELARENRA
jgi:RNA polymerase sigma-70 factor (ECF subfamily)